MIFVVRMEKYCNVRAARRRRIDIILWMLDLLRKFIMTNKLIVDEL